WRVAFRQTDEAQLFAHDLKLLGHDAGHGPVTDALTGRGVGRSSGGRRRRLLSLAGVRCIRGAIRRLHGNVLGDRGRERVYGWVLVEEHRRLQRGPVAVVERRDQLEQDQTICAEVEEPSLLANVGWPQLQLFGNVLP